MSRAPPALAIASGAATVPVLFDDVGSNSYRRLDWTVAPDRPQVTAVAI